MNNLLFDKGTKRIVAILDFDWSTISNPLDEFFSCLGDVGANISDEDNDIDAAILSGDFFTLPANLDQESIKRWESAKAWNTAMKKGSVVSPSDIKGVDSIRDILRLHTLLCPFQLGNMQMLEQIHEKGKAELRAKAEADFVLWLEKHGF